MKKVLYILIFLILIAVSCYGAETGEEGKELKNAISDTGTESIEKIFPEFDFSSAISSISEGKTEFNVLDIFKKALSYFLKEFKLSLTYFILIIAVAVLAGITESFEGPFNEDIKTACFFGVFSFMAGTLINSFMGCSEIGIGVIDDISVFFKALIPTLCTYLAMGGNVVLAGSISPLMFLLLQILTEIINSVFVPCINSLCALTIMNSLTVYAPVTRLIGFIKSFLKWGLSLMLTIFLGILSIQGFLGGASDSVTIKTAKFLVGGAVPVVGGMLSESVDMVVTSGNLIKNAVGTAGLIAIIGITVMPVIKMLVPIIILNLCSALTEPICDKKFSDAVSGIASCMSLLLVCVLCVFMFCVVGAIMMFKSGVIS